MRSLFIVISLLGFHVLGLAQENVTTVGFQLKPMIQTSFIDYGGGEVESGWLSSNYSFEGGYAGGMVIRRGFTPSLSLETGISYIKRNFRVDVTDIDSLYSGEMEYSLIAYQIPIQGLVYARLSKRLYMNASGGLGVNLMPSDVETNTFEHRQTTYRIGRQRWLKTSLIANYGFEYRTKKDGYFYLGASYDRPLGSFVGSRAIIKRESGEEQFTDGFFTGAYFTLDFRYFFHEDPERKKRVKKSIRPSNRK